MALENAPVPLNTPVVFVTQSANGVATFVVLNKVYPPPAVPPLPVRIKLPPERVEALKEGGVVEPMVKVPSAGLKVAVPDGRRITELKLPVPAVALLNNL
jgi:hypothetical protein